MALGACCAFVIATSTPAQVVDTTRIPPVPVVRSDSAKRDSLKSDSAKAKAGVTPVPSALSRTPVRSMEGALVAEVGKPPLTPKRAFLYSLMIPGWGQYRLDRGSAGALFATVELGSWAMVRKTGIDLRQSRRYSGDSLPGNYAVGTDGKIVGTGSAANLFEIGLVNTRRLHREDWFAALLFNHLISGADAFVSAQLWDVPKSLAIRPYQGGMMLVATIPW